MFRDVANMLRKGLSSLYASLTIRSLKNDMCSYGALLTQCCRRFIICLQSLDRIRLNNIFMQHFKFRLVWWWRFQWTFLLKKKTDTKQKSYSHMLSLSRKEETRHKAVGQAEEDIFQIFKTK